MKTIEIATVRAIDVPALSVVRLDNTVRNIDVWVPRREGGKFHHWESTYDGVLMSWLFIYDVNNGDGIEEGAELHDSLHEQFMLWRIAVDNPNNTENGDRYIAIWQNQLVSVQVAGETESRNRL